MFANRDRAYDLDWDYKGNVYAFGGQPYGTPGLQFVKIGGSGNIAWTFNADTVRSDYGDFTTDKTTGTSYLVGGLGGKVAKVNTNGMLMAVFQGDTNMNELWRAEFDQCRRKIFVAGGGTQGVHQGGILDTDMTSLTEVNVLGASFPDHDIALFTLDPDKNYCYMASVKAMGSDSGNFSNVISKISLPAMTPTVWMTPDNFKFKEVGSVPYAGSVTFGATYFCLTQGFNGAAATSDWLYLYDGDTLKQFNKTNGALVSRHGVRVNSGFEFGGLDADACNNILLGVADSIYAMDSTFHIAGKIQMPDTVYDIHFGQNHIAYACGNGYVTQFADPFTNTIQGSTVPGTCSACNGSATVNPPCGNGPFSYRWSNGATTQTATGLCANNYTVTVYDSSTCPPTSDTTVLTVTNNGGALTINTCCNDTLILGDSVSLTASGATSYAWTPATGLNCTNCASPIANPTVTTVYYVTATSGGCSTTDSITIVVKNREKPPLPCGNIFVPNAFSPNGDNINDFLYVYGNCIISLDFKIYDRWGNQVFETNDPAKGWDGKYNGQPLNSGVYDYTIIAIQSNGITTDQKGSITLVR
jgi:gliding motility-associated-like protein